MRKNAIGLIAAMLMLSVRAPIFADYLDASQDITTKGVYIYGSLSDNNFSDVTFKITDKASGELLYVAQVNPDSTGKFETSFKLNDSNPDNYEMVLYQDGHLLTGDDTVIMSVSDKYISSKPKMYITADTGCINASVSVDNVYFSPDYKYQVLFGLYDNNDRVKNVILSEEHTASETGSTITEEVCNYTGVSDVSYIKCFLVDRTGSIRPLCKSKLIIPSKEYKNAILIEKYCDLNKQLSFNFMGDSITFGDRTQKPYQYYIADKLNMYYSYEFKWPNTSEEITVKNNNDSINCINNYGICGNVVGQMLDRCNQMTADADIIFVMGGTNDYYFAMHSWVKGEFGTVDDTENTTFCGTYYSLLKAITDKYQDSQVVILTPIKRNGGENPNGRGKTLEDYSNAEIAIANQLGLPVIDLYHAPELDFDTLGWDVYTADGLHPNSEGDRLIGNYIVDKLVDMSIIEMR